MEPPHPLGASRNRRPKAVEKGLSSIRYLAETWPRLNRVYRVRQERPPHSDRYTTMGQDQNELKSMFWHFSGIWNTTQFILFLCVVRMRMTGCVLPILLNFSWS